MSADNAGGHGAPTEAHRLLEAAPISVVIVTDDGQYLYRNPAHNAMYGYKTGQLPLRSSEMWVDPAERTRLLDIFRQTGVLTNTEVQHHTADGRTFWG
ncbi:MAG TPA: PAS domain-containing protein, partial [Caulobacteraceae bacterium]|nr:PAS domain-containing protein [Caulobacteraceae bacterium]